MLCLCDKICCVHDADLSPGQIDVLPSSDSATIVFVTTVAELGPAPLICNQGFVNPGNQPTNDPDTETVNDATCTPVDCGDCDDGNSCTDDVCVAGVGCISSPLPAGTLNSIDFSQGLVITHRNIQKARAQPF